jgi:ubiquinone/menaquinone biosynthesis C-methylase UbiE
MSQNAKAHSRERFSQYAANYVNSERHAKGDDLELLAEMANPQPGWQALDIATGGGHTALRLAPHVRLMIATDYAPIMLKTAQSFIESKGAINIRFAPADAENLPFARESFDLITCRIAPHHFPDCFRFVQECARTLKIGGRLVVEDQLAPEDDRAARYIDSFERLRDPSHQRNFAEYEWRGMFLDAGLTVERVEIMRRPTRLQSWTEAQGNEQDVVFRLNVMLKQAPPPAADWLQPRAIGSPEAEFDHTFILISGQKR